MKHELAAPQMGGYLTNETLVIDGMVVRVTSYPHLGGVAWQAHSGGLGVAHHASREAAIADLVAFAGRAAEEPPS